MGGEQIDRLCRCTGDTHLAAKGYPGMIHGSRGGRLRALATCVAAMLAPAGLTAQAHAPTQASAVAFWSSVDSSWNARDAARFSTFFTDDALFSFVDRQVALARRDSIHVYFVRRFGALSADLRLVTEVRSTRELAPGVLAVDGRVTIVDTSDSHGAPAEWRKFAIAAVLVRQSDSAWRIRMLWMYLLPS